MSIESTKAKLQDQLPGGSWRTPSKVRAEIVRGRDASGEWEPTGEFIDIFNDHASPLAAGSLVKAIKLLDGNWYVIAASC